MKRRARKEAAGMALPSMVASGPSPQDFAGIAMCAQKAADPPRNRVADLAKAEAFYLSLSDLPIHVPWEVREPFKAAVAVAITEMRLRP